MNRYMSGDTSSAKKINPWILIDTYFRDNPYYKSQHQVDSYNEFVYSKLNGIEHLLKRENPQIIYKEPLEGGGYRYQITIYYATHIESLHDDLTIHKANEDNNVYISSPVEYNDGESQYMFPNIARLKGYTYASAVLCNISVILQDTQAGTHEIKYFEKVHIGKIPIMIKSKLCMLDSMDSARLTEVGECPYDQGGYFIIKGKEKVILSQEKKINNILYTNSQNDEIVPMQSTLTSVSNEGFQSSRNNTFSLHRQLIPDSPLISSEYKREVYRITVRILGINETPARPLKIPLGILFRALGTISDKDILQTIIYDTDESTLQRDLFSLLEPSLKDNRPICDQRGAIKFLALHTKGQETIHVIELLMNNFLPTYKSNNEKAMYLGYSIRRLLLTRLGVVNETDRDSYSMKRIDLAGSLLSELYRELWSIFQRNVSLKIDTEYKFNFKQYGNNIMNLVSKDNIKKIFNPSCMDKLMKSFGSVFGTGLSGRQGIVQDLNRAAALATLSHIRRISFPLPAGSKTLGPRKLHNSQWGFVCPSESPDGGNVGIINHLSIFAQVSFNISSDGIYEALLDHGMKCMSNCIASDLCDTCKLFMNGTWVGIHKTPDYLYKLLRLLKLNGIIHPYTSIYWDNRINEMYIFCDGGRLLRPVYVVRGNGDKKTNPLIEGDYTYATTWQRTIRGYMYTIDPDISIYDETYYREELQDIKLKYPDYMQYLQDMQAMIEYIDPLESEGLWIAKDVNTMDKPYTHCEIHSSLILSAVALNIPFPEHSQYPRNVFSCQQTKQAVGLYSSAYGTRFDTFAHVLNYPQKPLVTTRYKKYTDVDKLPYGTNCIVAIASYSGYNQEDGVILNKTSIDRGMFRSLYYRSYEASEEILSSGDRVYFGNPNYQSDIQTDGTTTYDKLDKNGFIREGEHVSDTDAIIGLCQEKRSEDNTGRVTHVSSEKIKFSSSGIVDKVVVYKNSDNLRSCKIRIRKEKIPTIGDKYSSRPGQKGMCGMVLEQSEMPFTEDGIVPDMIINPHAIPSRMTINQLLEVVLGKSACLGGFLGDATAFQNNEIRDYATLMKTYGYESWGNEIMYSGITGEQLHTSIFIGPTYYQRLKIMVADKIHSRGEGPLQSLTRQPRAGRANNGGLRIGEMERDSILGHGMAGFMNESMMERSDKYNMTIDTKDGLLSNTKDEDNTEVQVPYSFKLLLQELQCMSLAPRLSTQTTQSTSTLYNSLLSDSEKIVNP